MKQTSLRKTKDSKHLLKNLAEHLLATNLQLLKKLLTQKMENGATVEEYINAAIAKIGEKITLRRFASLSKN